MKTLKLFFAIATAVSVFCAVYFAMLFNGDSISFDAGWLSLIVCAVIATISFRAYHIVKKTEEENADWMELLKKPRK